MLTGLSFAAEHHYHPHRDVTEVTTVDDGHETATDKVQQERRAGRTRERR